MKKRGTAAVILAAVLLLAGAADAEQTREELSFGPFGRMVLYRPVSEPSGVVLFLSGDGGWNKGVVHMAKELVRLGAVVVGIDTARYLRRINEEKGTCSYPAADLEALSKYVQMRLGLPLYHMPVLAGYSSGATVVYAVLAQSPPNTFAGGISLGFCPGLVVSKPFCKGRGLEGRKGPGGKGQVFAPASVLSGEWTLLQGESDRVCSASEVKQFATRVPNSNLILLPGIGHGFSVQPNWLTQLKMAYAGMERAGPKGMHERGWESLPIVELPSQRAGSGLLAVILSGDGGWASIDRDIGEELQHRGIAVAGLNSLHYFWKARTPDSTAEDVTSMLRHYLGVWNKQRAILIGYSFGADVLPFVVNRLPADLRESVVLVVLVGPDRDADFEFHLADWLGGGQGGSSLPLLPEVKKVRGVKLLCIYGSEEKQSPCRDVSPDVAEAIELPGGHHFDGNYSAIVDRMLKYVH